MVLYKCDRCGKLFYHFGNYTRHIERKYPCSKMNLTESKNSPKKSNTVYDLKNIESVDESKKNNSKKSTTPYQCFYCKKYYSSNSNMNKHMNKVCKVKIEHDNEKEDIYKKLLDDMNKLQSKVYNLEKENKELKSSMTISNAKTVNNTINNNTINNTFKLTAFGKEDLSFIVDEASKKILHKGFRSIPVLTKYTHFNKNKPEFHNIYISNNHFQVKHLLYNNYKLEHTS